MSKYFLAAVISVVFLILWSAFTYAQLPPETTLDGVPFLKVNINPTNIPPFVNINPYNVTPRVEVTQLPDIQFTTTPSGCSDGQNFRTTIGSSIVGPLMVTYLNTSQQSVVTLVDNQGTRRVDLSPDTQITTAIYVGPGQTLAFNSNVMYSGCVPD